MWLIECRVETARHSAFRQQSENVCGFVKHGLTSGLTEAFNKFIARIIHKACGYRDLDYLELKLRQSFRHALATKNQKAAVS
jgi:hypothetical protein